MFGLFIMITCPCNEHPLTPHFYIEKVGFTRVYIFFLFLLQNIDCGYSLEPLEQKKKKNIKKFHLKIIIFTAVKYCCILHGHVCVMYFFFIFHKGHTWYTIRYHFGTSLKNLCRSYEVGTGCGKPMSWCDNILASIR